MSATGALLIAATSARCQWRATENCRLLMMILYCLRLVRRHCSAPVIHHRCDDLCQLVLYLSTLSTCLPLQSLQSLRVCWCVFVIFALSVFSLCSTLKRLSNALSSPVLTANRRAFIQCLTAGCLCRQTFSRHYCPLSIEHCPLPLPPLLFIQSIQLQS